MLLSLISLPSFIQRYDCVIVVEMLIEYREINRVLFSFFSLSPPTGKSGHSPLPSVYNVKVEKTRI
jgi:hypothetical protein